MNFIIKKYFNKLNSSELEIIWNLLLEYLNHHHFVLINLKEAGFQEKDGNILIEKAIYINDHRLSFGKIESNFGSSIFIKYFIKYDL